MRKWLGGKLFDLAAWLYWDDSWRADFTPPKRKVGRPKGSKDKTKRKAYTRKVRS